MRVSVRVESEGAQEALARQTEAIIWGDGAKLSVLGLFLHPARRIPGDRFHAGDAGSKGAANKNS